MSTNDKIPSHEEVEIHLMAFNRLRSFLKAHKIQERSETGQLLVEFQDLLTDDFVNWTDNKRSV